MKSRSGFTLVEVVITIAIISILSAITVIAYIQVQTNSRNSARKGNVTVLAEALEKYYAKNGEYPSVRSLVNNFGDNTGAVVASKLGVDVSVLMMPKMPSGTTNSLTSIAPANDYVQYVASSDVNNSTCQDNLTGGCDQFTLKYNQENGALVTVESNHKGRPDSLGTIPNQVNQPTLSVALSGTNVVATATADPCENASLTAKFSFRYRTNGGPWSAYSSWSTSSSFSIAGGQGNVYDFQAATRCDNGPVAGQTSPESNVVSYTYPISAPNAPSVTVSLSGSNALATISDVSCPAGTSAAYATRSRVNDGTWSNYSSWSGSSTASQPASQGYKYGYQAKARCQLGTVNSGETEGSEGTFIRPILAPSAPNVTQSTSGSVTTWSWPATSCPAGTMAEYQERDTADWGYDSDWQGPFGATYTSSQWTTGTYQGYQYTEAIQTRCKNSYTTGSWSASGQASYITPISTPGVPTGFVASLSSDRKIVTWNWTAPSCPTGLQNQDQKAPRFPPAAYGAWTAQGWWVPTWTQALTNPPTAIPSGRQFQMKAKYVCVNATTGRQGAYGAEGASGVYTAP